MDCRVPGAHDALGVPCPGCGKVGRQVGGVTVESMLGSWRAAKLLAADPRFCRTRDCDVLYYGNGGCNARKDEARVRVGAKEKQDPIPICYCFAVTRADIERELAETGGCTAAERIGDEVKAGNCACETRNPSGSCCLGEVRREIEEARLRLGAGGRKRT
jgi:hypothetical protein